MEEGSLHDGLRARGAPRPAFLALPGENDAAFPSLSRRLGLLVVRELLLLPAADLPGGMRRSFAAIRKLLTTLLERSPDTLLDAVRNPDVMAPLLAMKSGAFPAPESLAAAIPNLLVTLAGSSAFESLRESILWEWPVHRVVDARRGRTVAFANPAHSLLSDASGVEVELASGSTFAVAPRVELRGLPDGVEVTEPFHAISDDLPSLRLALLDTNPLAMIEGHPEKRGNALDLGSRAPREWIAALDEALGLVRAGIPTWHAEIPAALDRILPVGWGAERHLSASYREAPRIAYLSLHPSALTLAEAIVHETQHTKVNVLSWFDPVLENAWTEWTESPVRPDLRPLMGVLMAAHAFVPVAALHHGLAVGGHQVASTPEFQARRAHVLASNGRALSILQARGRPTMAGARLLQGLETLHAELIETVPGADAWGFGGVEPDAG
jgi:HEXXH motif-containing protein